ncbi:MAG: thioredoxin fold domain-containing protein [Thiohalomonadales bacterium]
MKKRIMAWLMAATVVPFLFASSVTADDNIAGLQTILKKIMPRSTPDSIAESILPGLYEVIYGAQVIYISGDGRYMVEGDIFDMQTRVNLTEGKRQGGRLKAVSSIDKDSLIIFKAKDGKTKHVITVFTDIDCGYCRKLHKEMADYNNLGIEIQYASFPRSGVDTASYYKAIYVWCAKDPQKAMNFAKNGAKLEQLKTIEQVEGKDCSVSIKKHLATAREIGVTGTPTLVMSDGQVVPGYVPAKRLIQMLDKDKKS